MKHDIGLIFSLIRDFHFREMHEIEKCGSTSFYYSKNRSSANSRVSRNNPDIRIFREFATLLQFYISRGKSFLSIDFSHESSITQPTIRLQGESTYVTMQVQSLNIHRLFSDIHAGPSEYIYQNTCCSVRPRPLNNKSRCRISATRTRLYICRIE